METFFALITQLRVAIVHRAGEHALVHEAGLKGADKRALHAQLAAERNADLQRRHDVFDADELETFNGVSMATDEPWRMWRARCAARREEAGDRRSFSLRLAARGSSTCGQRRRRPSSPW
jgi:hypothetical protein